MFRSDVFELTETSKGRTVPILAHWKGKEKLLCSRLTPPPVPPWLLDSPDKLRHVVANCSSWQTYRKLCAKDLKANYPALWTVTQANGFHVTEAIGVQWIPTLVTLIFTAILFLVVFCAYFLYRHKGICNKLLPPWRSVNKYKQQLTPSTSRDYCSPGLSLTPSVTVETQLSLWALEDHTPFNNLHNHNPHHHGHHHQHHHQPSSPFTLDTDPSLAILTSTPSTSCWSVGRSDSGSNFCSPDAGAATTNEVLLRPEGLADSHFPLVDVLSDPSIRGHPVDTSTYPCLEPLTSSSLHDQDERTERYCQLPTRSQGGISGSGSPEIVTRTTNQDFNDTTDANFQRGSQSVLLFGGGSGKSKNKAHKSPQEYGQNILKTCQTAGAKLVTKLSRRPSFGKSKQRHHQSQHNAGRKIEASMAKLRQSLADSRFSLRRSRANSTNSSGSNPTRANDQNWSSQNNNCPTSPENEIANGQYYSYENDSDRLDDNNSSTNLSNMPIYCNVNESPDDILDTINTSNAPTPTSSSTEGIYSYAANIPNDSDSDVVVTKAKRPTYLFAKRPRFLKNHKFFKS